MIIKVKISQFLKFGLTELEGHFGIDRKKDNISEPDTWTVYEENLVGIVIDIIPTIGILLIYSIRYILITITIIAAFSILWEYYKKEKINSSKYNKKT